MIKKISNWLDFILIKLRMKKDNSREKEVHVRDIDLDEIWSRDKRIRELNENKILPSNKKNDEEKKTCPFCHEKTEETLTCIKCGKEICHSCGTYCSIPCVEKDEFGVEHVIPAGYYCEDCW